MSILASRKRGIRRPNIKLGVESPLSTKTIMREDQLDGQGFHFGWFTSLILAGLAGFGLMLGALYTASDHKLQIAQKPDDTLEDTNILASGQADRSKYGAQKSNRLAIVPLLTQVKSEKETIEISQSEDVDGVQVIRIIPYTRISTDLARSRTQLTQNLKDYNPISLMTAAAEIQKGLKDRDNDEFNLQNDSGVTLSVSDLAIDTQFTAKDEMTEGQVLAVVSKLVKQPIASVANFSTDVSTQTISLNDIVDSQDITDFSEIEDIAEIHFKKTPFSALTKNITREIIHPVMPDDELTLVLSSLGVLAKDLNPILDAIHLRFDSNDLAAGQFISIGFGEISSKDEPIKASLFTNVREETPSIEERPFRVSISNENRVLVSIGRTASGRYVPLVTDDDYTAETADSSSISLYHSVYETALRSKVPEEIIEQIIHIFSFDIDYRKRVSPGDKLNLVFDRDEDNLENAQLLYASLEVDGKTKSFYRYKTEDDGYIDYYDPAGRSAKKFLLRKPMHAGKFRSGFGMRRHPVTRRYRMHAGVDWSARSGTPIVAAGDGRVIKASWAGGYGRQVKIQHKHGYVSSYSHMRRYGRGIKEGTFVRQGQIIGYVGTSGLSTGPHLHYELIVNKRKVDPLGIRLPRGRTLSGDLLSHYESQKEHIKKILDMPSTGDSLNVAKALSSNSDDVLSQGQPLPQRRPKEISSQTSTN